MVPTASLAHGGAAEFSAPEHERVLQHAAFFQIPDERRAGLIRIPGRLRHAGLDFAVVIPSAVVELDEADVPFCEAVLAPLVTFRVVVDGGEHDGESSITASAGDVINYRIVGKVANLGTTNTGLGESLTVQNLVDGIDGMTIFRFNLGGRAGDPVEIDFQDRPTLVNGFNTTSFGASRGVITPRGGGLDDVTSIHAVQSITYVGVEGGAPTEVTLAQGAFKVRSSPNGEGVVRMTPFTEDGPFALIRINDGLPLFLEPHGGDAAYKLVGLTVESDGSGPAGDSTKPTAKLSASNLTNGGGSTHEFNVTYSDNSGIKVATLGNGDVRVVAPNGKEYNATLIAVNNQANGTPRTARYRLTIPGVFDSTDNGRYTVKLMANQVSDTSNNFAAAATLGSFNVNVPFAVMASGGRLLINGDLARPDNVALSVNKGTLTAKLGKQARTFKASSVKSITIATHGGNDKVTLGAGVIGAQIDGGSGNDSLFGGAGNDQLNGGAGNDSLRGNGGNDIIKGGSGFDKFSGDAGDDRLFSRDAIKDTLSGGSGNDRAQVDALDVRDTIEQLLK
jgi:Ca2+-binding RTX toxin-like protein